MKYNRNNSSKWVLLVSTFNVNNNITLIHRLDVENYNKSSLSSGMFIKLPQYIKEPCNVKKIPFFQIII